MKNIRIVYISSSFIPSKSANSIHVMKMCQAFARNGHAVTLLAMLGRAHGVTGGVVFDYYGVRNIFCLKRFFTPDLRFVRPIWYGLLTMLFLIRKKPDLVYTREITGALLAVRLNTPVIYELHDSLVNTPKERIFKRILKNNNLKRIVVISAALKTHMQKAYDVDNERIVVAHDAADPVEASKNNIASKHPLSKERLKAGYIGHLYKGRGVEIIMEMAKCCPWADFHLIGGNDTDVKHLKSFGKNQNNIFIHGFMPYEKAANLRQQFDVLLAPYQTKVNVSGNRGNTAKWMSPLKIFEYMSSGKPIICSDIPVLKEVLTNEKNALLCAPDNIEAWEKALIRMRDDKDLRSRLAGNALKDFHAKYTWRKRAELVVYGLSF